MVLWDFLSLLPTAKLSGSSGRIMLRSIYKILKQSSLESTNPPRSTSHQVNSTIPSSVDLPEPKYQLVSLDLIDDPERPIRQELAPESVKDLVLSIKQVGILEPLVVKPVGKRFEVIAGHRRLVAAGLAGVVLVPCVVRDCNPEQTEMLKMHENLYRADIKPSDEAEHFKYLIEKHKLTPIRISKLISRSESYVGDRLAIFNYPDPLRRALDAGQISFSVAREFNRMSDYSKMKEYLNYAIRNGITSKLARDWVADYNRSRQPVDEAEQVEVTHHPSTGKIEYTSTCVYCQRPIKLSEANVVYIHDECLVAASKPRVQNDEIVNHPPNHKRPVETI